MDPNLKENVLTECVTFSEKQEDNDRDFPQEGLTCKSLVMNQVILQQVGSKKKSLSVKFISEVCEDAEVCYCNYLIEKKKGN